MSSTVDSEKRLLAEMAAEKENEGSKTRKKK